MGEGDPHPVSMRGGYPIQSQWGRGYPIQSWLRRCPIQSQWGVPHPVSMEQPHQEGWDTRHHLEGWDTPFRKDGSTLSPARKDGVPPAGQEGWGCPLSWMGVPPLPAGVDWHTYRKYNLPPSFGCGRLKVRQQKINLESCKIWYWWVWSLTLIEWPWYVGEVHWRLVEMIFSDELLKVK